MRKIILTIHLFLSLTLGLFIVVTCTTGSLVLIEPDVEKLLYPIGQKPSPGDVGPAAIQQRADALHPDFKTSLIEWPDRDGFYHVHLEKDGKDERVVYADPGTGAVFGQVAEDRREPFATIYNLHRYFLLTTVIGKQNAASFVGLLGGGLLLILATGIYLWWPGIKKMALGFRIVRSRGRLMHNMSLHKTIGIISIPVLLLASLTGLLNAFEKSIPGWVGFNAREEIPKSAMQSARADTVLPVDRIVDIVRKSHPDSRPIRIQLPQKPGDTYQVGLREGFGTSDRINSTIYLDASNGEVRYKTNPNLAINLYNTWRKDLHFAVWGGLTVQLITFAFGMMPLVLMVTGLVIWRLKARARKRSGKQQRSQQLQRQESSAI
ncbi:PepSY-associated TM helix domain-containing protein [Paenibacillus humicola]|uniref:PepSY-associated TM helix domain-containing protein n=1 Tax=Paenibacillus humicola TaxID=3110540 RepID=UPI00237C11E7|nr:PepSY-associated TM helix domain-containing protein [Paenibacillus humicola]